MYPFIVKNFILPTSDKILGLTLGRELRKWRKIQWYTRDKLEQLQLVGLQKILNHCYDNIPYYKDVFQKVGYLKSNDQIAELKKLPFLDKKIIKENLPSGILDKNRNLYFIDHTSGSSGIQGEFYSDKAAFSIATAIHFLWREWAGYQLGDKLIQTGITFDRGFLKKIKDILFRVKYTQAFDMDSKIITDNLNSVKKEKIKFFMGYAKDYVECMWLMLQQSQPDDYIVATGRTYSVREFVNKAFKYAGLDYKDYVETSEKYLRPTDVELLLGDPSKAVKELGWNPNKTSLDKLIQMMVDSDMKLVEIQKNGFNLFNESNINLFEHFKE